MKNPNVLFFGSIFLGILIWFFFYFITPIEVKNNVSFFTVSFISLSYLALILGYILTNYFLNHNQKKRACYKNLRFKHIDILLKVLIILIIISFLFRYFDLFFNRNVSFNSLTFINKQNASNPQNFSLAFFFLSSFRVLFFVPLVYYFSFRMNNNKLLFVCLFLFVLPFMEAYLRGSRRIVFESLWLIAIILFIFGKIKSVKNLIPIFVAGVVFLSFSLFVIKNRVSQDNNVFYSKIFSSQYNEFVPPTEDAINFIHKNRNNILSDLCFSEIHLGQYIVHGVFEMDYMISNKPKKMYGQYNTYLFIKFLNKLGVLNIPLSNLNNPTKRITYLTFFGGMFLDFGWFAIAIMFLFGTVQSRLLFLSKENQFMQPIIVLLIFSNLFMLIFNFFRMQFVFSITIYLLFIIGLFFVIRIKKSSFKLI